MSYVHCGDSAVSSQQVGGNNGCLTMPSELDTLKAAGNIATDCGEKLHQLTYPKFVGWHVEMRLAMSFAEQAALSWAA